MTMVNIGIVGMRVDEPLMSMTMAVRFARRIIGRMHMLMMLIVHMGVRVLQLFVNVFVLVSLGEMQPHAYSHACRAECKCGGWSLA